MLGPMTLEGPRWKRAGDQYAYNAPPYWAETGRRDAEERERKQKEEEEKKQKEEEERKQKEEEDRKQREEAQAQAQSPGQKESGHRQCGSCTVM